MKQERFRRLHVAQEQHSLRYFSAWHEFTKSIDLRRGLYLAEDCTELILQLVMILSRFQKALRP